MKTIAIVAKPHGDRVRPLLEEMISFLTERGVTILKEKRTAEVLGEKVYNTDNEIREKSDLVVVLGGDGTLISAVRILGMKETPILGVNLGRLGFLTETRASDALATLKSVLDGDYRLERRMKLHSHLLEEDEKVLEIDVLNDLVINKSDVARIIEMSLYINKVLVNEYRADGLIVATPTGSTAYSLAAGGPIVHPSLETMVITPICPQGLSNRPIVISDDSEVEIRIKTGNEKVSITFDGQIYRQLDTEKTITVKKASTCTQLIVPKDKNYYALIREKLGWGGVQC
ncbi:NAD(+)/NADH kinase [Seleniivibrio sp.]|uniref:NAD(+)/NADH kinase n=1 Tax=Seleniivibrio sp. TaxID=2898801 RepID=UPI0025EC5C13|nr:NAD(+)/NADH kinase [Seleniivibrio sp.]MCD8553812.1 NAD(+)/NADH kinase [Seleniivibrio sp.]